MFKWEREEERLLKFMRIPPKKKMEWLLEMNEFMAKVTKKSIHSSKTFRKKGCKPRT